MFDKNPSETVAKQLVTKHQSKHWLLVILAINSLATLTHYTDNFIFFDKYPAPSWMVPSQVYTAWLVLTPFAVIGYILYVKRQFLLSYGCLGIYSITGVSSFGHYFFGSVQNLSVKMNTLICLDVLSGITLLSFVAWSGLIKKEWQTICP